MLLTARAAMPELARKLASAAACARCARAGSSVSATARSILERSKNPIRTRVNSARRDVAPAHDASTINDKQRALTGAIRLVVHTVSPRYRAFRLEVGQQRKAQLALLG